MRRLSRNHRDTWASVCFTRRPPLLPRLLTSRLGVKEGVGLLSHPHPPFSSRGVPAGQDRGHGAPSLTARPGLPPPGSPFPRELVVHEGQCAPLCTAGPPVSAGMAPRTPQQGGFLSHFRLPSPPAPVALGLPPPPSLVCVVRLVGVTWGPGGQSHSALSVLHCVVTAQTQFSFCHHGFGSPPPSPPGNP